MKSKKNRKEGRSLPDCLRVILKSGDVSKRISCTFSACEEVIVSSDTWGIEIIAAVFTLVNFFKFYFIQLSVHLVYLPGNL
jgi:hypothetical protein